MDKIEFDRMTYRIYGNKKTVKDFPDMNAYKDVWYAKDIEDLDPDMVFRYICYAFDPNSPSKNFPDVKRRRTWALQMVNIEPPYSDVIDQMLRWKIKGVNRRAILFMGLIAGERYARWQYYVAKQNEIMEMELDLSSKDAVDIETKKDTILKNCAIELEKAKEAFLQGEKSAELEQSLMVFTIEDTLGLRMEEVIRKKEMGEDVFPEVDN